MTRPQISGVPGVQESVLSRPLLARLPVDAPPAPWTGRCEAVVWTGRGGHSARAALPPALRRTGRPLAVVGALLRYSDTPVGAYDEVLAMVVTLRGLTPTGTVAFMAVDSEA